MALPGQPIDDLVAAVVADDPRARDALLAELLPMVRRYCRARIGHRETPLGSADDIAQDVCRAVVRALSRYEARGLPLDAFVYRMAADRVAGAYRAAVRDPTDPATEPPDAAAAGSRPEAHQLDGLLHLLPPQQREVLVLRIAVGLSSERTAGATGFTPDAVRVVQHRALTRLRRHVRAEVPADDTVEVGRIDEDVDPEVVQVATVVDVGRVGSAQEPIVRLTVPRRHRVHCPA